MRCVVTGAAGFIGSHLCEHLLDCGHDVRGIDAFIPYYAPATKVRNLDAAMAHSRFRFHRSDLRQDPLESALADADVVFHLAAMPGLTRSWSDFDGYWTCNVLATQRLLEAIHRSTAPPQRVVYASTSSVYGELACGPETQATVPISPYGVTKLAAESLCRSYADAYGLPVVTLRYFSVYGPRQRPDMGYHKFIRAMLRDEPVTVCGDGEQVRGNTYVADCVEATVAAANATPGEIFNVGGGEAASVWDILRRLEALAGRPARVRQAAGRPGDQRRTLADTSKLSSHLGWKPRTTLTEGLARQWEWQAKEMAGGGHLAEPVTQATSVPSSAATSHATTSPRCV
jgi:nucleoside-diphosphate-sugar epimerase